MALRAGICRLLACLPQAGSLSERQCPTAIPFSLPGPAKAVGVFIQQMFMSCLLVPGSVFKVEGDTLKGAGHWGATGQACP